MTGKSEGTGLLDDSGKVVREISANLVDLDPRITKLVNDNFFELLYQNDGMGCPGEDMRFSDGTGCLGKIEKVKQKLVVDNKKPKATKIRRVK